MEPESQFYTDPVVVLDFQSLYPSMVLAYNLCYSTCLGRLQHTIIAPPQRNSGEGSSNELEESRRLAEIADTRGKVGFMDYPKEATAQGAALPF